MALQGTTAEKEMILRLYTVVRVATLALLMAPLAAAAQQAGKVYRVGILGETASDPSEARLWQVFRLALRERGWMEGEPADRVPLGGGQRRAAPRTRSRVGAA